MSASLSKNRFQGLGATIRHRLSQLLGPIALLGPAGIWLLLFLVLPNDNNAGTLDASTRSPVLEDVS